MEHQLCLAALRIQLQLRRAVKKDGNAGGRLVIVRNGEYLLGGFHRLAFCVQGRQQEGLLVFANSIIQNLNGEGNSVLAGGKGHVDGSGLYAQAV